MHTTKCLRFFLAIALSGLSASALLAAPPAKYIIHARGGFSQAYLRGPGVAPLEHRISDGVIHSKIRRGDDLYLVISCTVYSGGNPNGRCGAGEESSLYWLHVHGNTVVKAREILYASCWSDIYGQIDGWKDRYFSASYEGNEQVGPQQNNQFVSITHHITFDCKAPEKGFEITADAPEKLPGS